MFDNYSNYKCHLDEPDDLASLADDLKVFEALEQEGKVERDDRQEIDHVHWGLGLEIISFIGAIGNCIAFIFLQTHKTYIGASKIGSFL